MFENVLNNIGFIEVFKILGENAILLYPNIKAEELKDIPIIIKSPDYILSLSKNTEITLFLQNKYVQQYQFPIPSQGFSSGITLSLTNTSLITRNHFIDLIFSTAREGFISDTLSTYQVSAQMIPMFYHLITICFYPKMVENPSKYSIYFQNDVKDIWGSSLYSRAKNDILFMNMCSNLLQKRMNYDQFLKYSFPYHLRSDLTQPDLLNFVGKGFIMYSDNDSQKDFDFMLIYLSIKVFLTLISMNNVDEANEYQYMNNIKHYISLVSPEMKSTACNELFSLIFLQKDGKFICPGQLAQTLLRTIEEYVHSPYIKQALISLLPSISGQRGLELENYFLAGKEALIKAVSDRNWPQAQKIIQRGPLYKEFFQKALNVYYLVTSRKQTNESEMSKEIQLEYGLSSLHGIKELKDIRNDYNQYSRLINNRIYELKSGTLMMPIKNNKTNINQYINNFDNDSFNFLKNRTGEAFKDVFSSYPNLSSFIEYISLYSRCIFDDYENNSLEFSFRSAFSSAINSGNMVDAVKLSNNIKIDLFEWVMEHINDFDLTKEFVTLSFAKHPLVCTYIAMTSFDPNQFDFIPDKFKRKNENVDDFSLLSFISKLEDSSLDDSVLDDYLYRLDARKMFNCVMERIDKLSDKRILHCIEITGIFRTNVENKRLNDLILINSIKYYTESTDEKEIVKALADNGKMALLVSFIEKHKSKENVEIALKNLKTGSKIFLRNFPEFVKFFIGNIKELENDMSGKEKAKFRVFSRLPNSLKYDLTILDDSSIIKTLSSSKEYLLSLSKADRVYLTQKNLMDIMKNQTTDNIIDFLKISRLILIISDSQKELKDICMKKIEEYIHSVEIKTNENEFKEFFIAAKIGRFMNNFKIISLTYSFYNDVLNSHPMTLFNLKYDFKVGSVDLQKALFVLDLTDSFMRMEEKMQFHGNDYYISKCLIILKYGMFRDAFKLLESRKLTNPDLDFANYDSSIFMNEKYLEKDLLSLSSPLFNPFIKNQFINHEMLELILMSKETKIEFEGNMAQLAIYPKINAIASKANKNYIPTKKNMRSDHQNYAEKFIKSFISMPKSITVLSSFGMFNDAIAQCLVSKDNIINVMMKYALSEVMANDSIKTFLKDLRNVDPAEKITKTTWEDLILEATKKSMHLLKFELFMSRNNRYAAALEALEEFRYAKKTLLQLIFIGNAYNCLIEAQHMESEELVRSDPFQQLLILTKLQKDICTLLHQHNYETCPDIVNNPNNVVDACVILLSLNETILFAELISILPQKSLLATVIKKALTNENLDVRKFALSVKKVYDSYGVLTLCRVITMNKLYHKVPSLLMKTIGLQHREILVKGLIEFDCLSAALAVIEEYLDCYDLIPMIAIRASQVGDIPIAIRCAELLQKNNDILCKY